MSDLGDRLRKLAERADGRQMNGIAVIVVDGVPDCVVVAESELYDNIGDGPERLQMSLGLLIYQATNMKPATEQSS